MLLRVNLPLTVVCKQRKGFGRLEIEEDPPLRIPPSALQVKEGGGRPQVTHRFDFFHAAPFDCLKADGRSDQSEQVSAIAVASKTDLFLKVDIGPSQPTRFAAGGGEIEKAGFKSFALLSEPFACAAAIGAF